MLLRRLNISNKAKQYFASGSWEECDRPDWMIGLLVESGVDVISLLGVLLTHSTDNADAREMIGKLGSFPEVADDLKRQAIIRSHMPNADVDMWWSLIHLFDYCLTNKTEHAVEAVKLAAKKQKREQMCETIRFYQDNPLD